uniref:Integrase catalytic domain-containing protein n=1 Tax=Oryzias latipes TaxID=8090 RepID=A0A3B3I997_ORYLA
MTTFMSFQCSFDEEPLCRELLEFIFRESQQLCDQLESQGSVMDLDFLYSRYEEFHRILLICADRGLLQDVDNIIENLQKVLQLLNAHYEPSLGFRPSLLMTGNRGRPSWEISSEQLQYLLDFHFTVREIARLFGVSYRTIRRRMSEYGLSVRMSYSDLPDPDLREIISHFIGQFPNSGIKTVSGYLNSIGLRIQRSRIMETLRLVDPVGTFFRGLSINIIPRRVYSVPAPMALWHIDGNHKLIRWRIVIHGGIDGYSRKIMYLQAADNNRASTVFSAFLEAIQQFGVPTRVRSDKGGENVEVARFMLEHPLRGPERRPFITGRSVHNQRIERLWRDVWRAVTVNYYHALQHLVHTNALNPDNELDMICLHYVMLPRINRHLMLFKQAWDRHSLSTEQGRSPQQLWIEGQLRNSTTISEPVIDWEGPTPTDTDGTVNVPEAPLLLKDIVLQFLQGRIVPLGDSTCFGVDILLQTLQIVREHFDTSS